jgi:hypothetical protein
MGNEEMVLRMRENHSNRPVAIERGSSMRTKWGGYPETTVSRSEHSATVKHSRLKYVHPLWWFHVGSPPTHPTKS